MSDLPAPLVPIECDLRDFTYMPLEVVRLRDSGIALESDDSEFRAAVMLWCASWHQVPAGSIPGSEEAQAALAGYGRDVKSWRKVQDGALRGFVLCADGRMYHRVVCEIALRCWEKKQKQRSRTESASKARWKRHASLTDSVTDSVTDNVGKMLTESKGREGKGSKGISPPNPLRGLAWEEGLFEAIRKTGKMPDLKLEHLAQWFRSVPAERKTSEAAEAIVMELDAWTGKVTSPSGWLARRVRALEPELKNENEKTAPAVVPVGPPVEAM